MSTDLNEFCDEFCVHRSFSTPYGPPTNAHAERMWGLLLRTTRILLVQSGVHESLWWYAVQQATMLHNYMPSTTLTGIILNIPQVVKITRIGQLVEIDYFNRVMFFKHMTDKVAADKSGSAGNQ